MKMILNEKRNDLIKDHKSGITFRLSLIDTCQREWGEGLYEFEDLFKIISDLGMVLFYGETIPVTELETIGKLISDYRGDDDVNSHIDFFVIKEDIKQLSTFRKKLSPPPNRMMEEDEWIDDYIWAKELAQMVFLRYIEIKGMLKAHMHLEQYIDTSEWHEYTWEGPWYKFMEEGKHVIEKFEENKEILDIIKNEVLAWGSLFETSTGNEVLDIYQTLTGGVCNCPEMFFRIIDERITKTLKNKAHGNHYDSILAFYFVRKIVKDNNPETLVKLQTPSDSTNITIIEIDGKKYGAILTETENYRWVLNLEKSITDLISAGISDIILLSFEILPNDNILMRLNSILSMDRLSKLNAHDNGHKLVIECEEAYQQNKRESILEGEH